MNYNELDKKNKENNETLFRFVTKAFAAWGVLWFVGGLFSLAVFGMVIYIALHFVAKYW